MEITYQQVTPYRTFAIRSLVLAIFILFSATSLRGQNALRDIPDPDPEVQLRMFQIAAGFEVNLFASDPMVVKPIQMNWDQDGRLWVVSSTVYPHLKPGEVANDKILVLEDSNGDGKADKSTVFAEGLITPTGILPGDGGVYVANSTEVLHLKDTDGDGKADERQTILTGFGTGDTHHLIHTFRWGPDGLLYFNQSIYIYSHVETPWGVRRLEGGGVWQYNPKTKQLEVFARGLINPWGLQFDRWGNALLTDGAGTEGINHAFQGATFVTAPGADRVLRGLNPGQPKHSGLDVVSGSHLPDDWQESLITNDFRANRINRFVLEAQGSGFVSKQAQDILWTDHIGFRPVDILMGPDGAIYVADWYNPIIQHGEVDFHDPRRDQQHGRIWRITKKDSPLVPKPKLPEMGIPELLENLKASENWTRLQSKLVLRSKPEAEVIPALEKWLLTLSPNEADYEHHLLEALWLYQTLGRVSVPHVEKVLQANHPGARAAALRVATHWRNELPDYQQYLNEALRDPDPTVRLAAVVSLQNETDANAAVMALTALEQEVDTNLEFALYTTVKALRSAWLPEILADPGYFGDDAKTIFALQTVTDPLAIELLGRLYADDQLPEKFRPQVIQTLARYGSGKELAILFKKSQQPERATSQRGQELDALILAARERNLLPESGTRGLLSLLESREEALVTKALLLVGSWKGVEYREKLVELIYQGSVPVKTAGMEALAQLEDDASKQVLNTFAGNTGNQEIQLLALAQLASKRPAEAVPMAVAAWNQGIPEEAAGELFGAFMRTEAGTRVLTENLSTNTIPATMAMQGRKVMQRYVPWFRRNSAEVKSLVVALEKSGGVLPPERMPQRLNENQVYALAQEVKTKADPVIGESIYRKKSLMCQNCHALGGAGGRLGPDLSSLGTSSPIDNIIQSLLDPSESVKEGYELQKVTKTDGSLFMGYLVGDGTDELRMRDMSGQETTIPKNQVANRENVPGSLMPPGLTASLEQEEFIHLVGYLSKLGSSGDFRVTNEKFVRNWHAVTDSEAVQSLLSGTVAAGETAAPLEKGSMALYSMVGGSLPLEDIPVLKDAEGREVGLVQFEVEVLQEGTLTFEVNSGKAVRVRVGTEELSMADTKVSTRVSQGTHLVQVVVDLTDADQEFLRIQVHEEGDQPSQNRLVMGN